MKCSYSTALLWYTVHYFDGFIASNALLLLASGAAYNIAD